MVHLRWLTLWQLYGYFTPVFPILRFRFSFLTFFTCDMMSSPLYLSRLLPIALHFVNLKKKKKPVLPGGLRKALQKRCRLTCAESLRKRKCSPCQMRSETALFFKYNFYYSTVSLQCCVSFCYTAKCISYTYTYSPLFFGFPSHFVHH